VDRWTSVSRYQNVSILDFIGARDYGGGGDSWNYKMCKAPVKLLPATKQHPALYMPDALSVTQQCQSIEGKTLSINPTKGNGKL